jgi:hypothetical protein
MPRLTNLVGANTSEARVPTAYKIDEILLTTFDGSTVYDIQAIVTDFTIIESLYTPAVQLSLNIKDNIDFMGQARLSGQEKIKIKVLKKPYSGGDGSSPDEQKIDLEFYVTEYPVYGRQNNLIQAYTIRGVTKHAYVSKLKRVSRAVAGKIGDIVKTICTKDLGIAADMLDISERASASINAVIPNLEPIDAIYWLVKRAFTDTGSPFYFYQSVDGKVYLKSQEELVSSSVFDYYSESKFFSADSNIDPVRAYNEAASRILALSSTINLGKPLPANSGAFASKTYYVDLPSKSISQKDFNYKEEEAKRVGNASALYITDKFKPEGSDDLSKYKDARQIVIPMNSTAYSAGANYNASTSGGNLAKASSYVELLDSMQHDLSVPGDMDLTSGKIVKLKLPAPIDPSLNKTGYTADGPSNEEDLILSGRYLVTSVQHNFAEDHIVEFRVKRDSLRSDIFSS